jgi:hypothetical protein
MVYTVETNQEIPQTPGFSKHTMREKGKKERLRMNRRKNYERRINSTSQTDARKERQEIRQKE